MIVPSCGNRGSSILLRRCLARVRREREHSDGGMEGEHFHLFLSQWVAPEGSLPEQKGTLLEFLAAGCHSAPAGWS